MSEPLVLVNLFTLPASAVDPFVAGWPASTAGLARAPGFRGTRLHRAVSPEAPYPLVNVARWDSAELWEAALSGFVPGAERRRQAQAGAFNSEPALYRVVSVTPDPQAARGGAPEPLVLISPFTMSAQDADAFVEAWSRNTAAQAQAPGFRGTRLHRALSPGNPRQIVNIARWDSAEPWEAAGSGWRQRGDQDPAGGVTWRAQPALYRVVSETPDPVAAQPSR